MGCPFCLLGKRNSHLPLPSSSYSLPHYPCTTSQTFLITTSFFSYLPSSFPSHHLHHHCYTLHYPKMGSRNKRRQRWCAVQPLTPLMEGPGAESRDKEGKKETSWEVIRSWVRRNDPLKRPDLRLLLGVLGCPLAPVSLTLNHSNPCLPLKGMPIETSSAHYIIQQYLASTGCLKLGKKIKNMYTSGSMKMMCCETEIGKGKTVGTRGVEDGCFVIWQMSPGMWSIELVVAGNKIIAGSNGKIVWRHTPWLGTHAAKGQQRPLRRIIQGLDPRSTACLFAEAQCLGEKRIGNEDCFVLKVAANGVAIVERNEGSAQVIRHVLYGYFSQKSGLLVYLEDSHLTRVETPGTDTIYWETTIGTRIGDYRDVEGVLIAHQGCSVATVFRFGEVTLHHSRTRMEEEWRIDDVVFNVPGLSMDYFIPPAEIFDSTSSP